MAEIRINATGGVKLYDADDSHYAQIIAGTITANTDVMTLGHAAVVMGTKLDLNGNNLILDADADTYLDGGTVDDVVDVYVAGAKDWKFGANSINILSGTTLTIDSGATITNNGTANSFGTTTVGGLTDVTMDATNFTDSLCIQVDSDGAAPTTGTLSSASNNLGIGTQVFRDLTSGVQNVLIGQAGENLTTANSNVAIGFEALKTATTQSQNVAIGDGAMQSGSPFDSVAVGFNTMQASNSGTQGGVAIVIIHTYSSCTSTTSSKSIHSTFTVTNKYFIIYINT